jgi:hypothetical protein
MLFLYFGWLRNGQGLLQKLAPQVINVEPLSTLQHPAKRHDRQQQGHYQYCCDLTQTT